MRTYKWLLENDAESVVTKLLEHKQDPQSKRRFYARKVFSLLLLICIEPVSKIVDSRDTVHYKQDTTLSICSIKTVDDKTYAKGIAFFDIVDRAIFVAIVFILSVVSGPLIKAMVLSFLLYVALACIDSFRVFNDLRSLERQVRYIGDTQ